MAENVSLVKECSEQVIQDKNAHSDRISYERAAKSIMNLTCMQIHSIVRLWTAPGCIWSTAMQSPRAVPFSMRNFVHQRSKQLAAQQHC